MSKHQICEDLDISGGIWRDLSRSGRIFGYLAKSGYEIQKIVFCPIRPFIQYGGYKMLNPCLKTAYHLSLRSQLRICDLRTPRAQLLENLLIGIWSSRIPTRDAERA